MTVLGVGIETAATMDSEPVIMVPGEPQTYTTQQKNQVDRFPISLMQSSSTIQLQTRQVQKETYKTQNTFWLFKSWARANRKILQMPTLLSNYVLRNLKMKSY